MSERVPRQVDDFAAQIAEAQRQLAESIVRAGLQRDSHRHVIEATSTVIGLFPELVAQMDATRPPIAASDLCRLIAAAASGAATGAQRQAATLARAANRRTLVIGVGVLIAAVLIGAGGGYWVRGDAPVFAGARAGLDRCDDNTDGSRICYIPVYERVPAKH